MSRVVVLWMTVLVAVFSTAALAARAEWVLATGARVLVPVRPRDPRSLVQGDFHALRYSLPSAPPGSPARGSLALRVDALGVVTGARVLVPPLGPDEVEVDYVLSGRDFEIAPSSFLIEEGTGPDFDAARYAELSVADGRAVLVRLRDAERHALGPEPRGW